jgi:hypothetical protein
MTNAKSSLFCVGLTPVWAKVVLLYSRCGIQRIHQGENQQLRGPLGVLFQYETQVRDLRSNGRGLNPPKQHLWLLHWLISLGHAETCPGWTKRSSECFTGILECLSLHLIALSQLLAMRPIPPRCCQGFLQRTVYSLTYSLIHPIRELRLLKLPRC